jgi:uncharacterized protein DUF6594
MSRNLSVTKKGGYDGLAREMGLARGMDIFKSFKELRLSTLLRKQSKLLHLEHELQALSSGNIDSQGGEELLRRIEALMDEIDEKLKEYSKRIHSLLIPININTT